MNAWQITTKNFNETFVLATNAENAVREARKSFQRHEKDYGVKLKSEATEIVRVRFVGFIGNV